MAYVDLNPIRANMAKTPEASKYTSIYRRIELLKKAQTSPNCLEGFVGIKQDSIGIPFILQDYLDLIDWTGRIIRPDKRGAISESAPPILDRLALPTDAWKLLTTEFEQQFQNWVGSEHIVKRACHAQGYQRTPKAQNLRRLFPT